MEIPPWFTKKVQMYSPLDTCILFLFLYKCATVLFLVIYILSSLFYRSPIVLLLLVIVPSYLADFASPFDTLLITATIYWFFLSIFMKPSISVIFERCDSFLTYDTLLEGRWIGRSLFAFLSCSHISSADTQNRRLHSSRAFNENQ